MLVIVLFAVLISYINPVVNFVGAWRNSHSERSQLAELQRQKAHLAARAASLKNPATAVEEARRLGMVLPGEHSFSIRGLPK